MGRSFSDAPAMTRRSSISQLHVGSRGFEYLRSESRAGVGYNGQLHEQGSGWQFLGNGFRAYSPSLMRFHRPDSMSPFGEGGINPYAYCQGDPVNFSDPGGHFVVPVAASLGIASVAMFGLAADRWSAGDEKKAELFATIAGTLGAFALAAVGMRMYWKKYSPLKMGALRIHRGRSKDVVNVHGSPNRSRVGDLALDGTQMADLLKSKGLGDKPIRFQACSSADGPSPQAQVLANAFGQPVTGYRGRVRVDTFTNKPFGDFKAVVFQPQTDAERARTAIRNTELNRRSQRLPRQHVFRLRHA
ncbi:RHS repeat-associated core domain-containing protein [Stenotrophomonas sp. 278]|nr:RHS repeat-associated core domain-containing protein [Stenotrophomonas sp. 278]